MTISMFMPTNGQFIAVWFYNGKLWSEVLRWEYNALLKYNSSNWWDDADAGFYEKVCATYITK